MDKNFINNNYIIYNIKMNENLFHYKIVFEDKT
jgi:hypothetical protein